MKTVRKVEGEMGKSSSEKREAGEGQCEQSKRGSRPAGRLGRRRKRETGRGRRERRLCGKVGGREGR